MSVSGGTVRSYKHFAGIVVLLAGVSQAQQVGCPAAQGKSLLAGVSVFDGPPAEMADLVPDVSRGSAANLFQSWEVGYLFDQHRTVYLACRYAGVSAPVVVKVEQRVKTCSFQAHGRTRAAEMSCR
jgi:hypothetical protein